MIENKKYRDTGAIGALLDEYERALSELKRTIKSISQEDMLRIVDPLTKDEDCRSIQTILSHVVHAGHNYVIAIRKWLGENIEYKKSQLLGSVDEYESSLNSMFEENVMLFADYPNVELVTKSEAKKILVGWGQRYDVDQLLEHAIVHILRHRRQIERFILKMNSATKTIS